MNLSPRTKFTTGLVIAIGIVFFYASIYQNWPFEDFLNNLILNGLTILSASLTVFGCWKILSTYKRDESQFKIWSAFLIGFALWASAEIVWAYISINFGEVPVPSLADPLWLIGYLFFGIGLAAVFLRMTIRGCSMAV